MVNMKIRKKALMLFAVQFMLKYGMSKNSKKLHMLDRTSSSKKHSTSLKVHLFIFFESFRIEK